MRSPKGGAIIGGRRPNFLVLCCSVIAPISSALSFGFDLARFLTNEGRGLERTWEFFLPPPQLRNEIDFRVWTLNKLEVTEGTGRGRVCQIDRQRKRNRQEAEASILISSTFFVLKRRARDRPRFSLTSIRVSKRGVQENQVHSITIQSLEVPNLNFQPIPPISKFYSMAT